MKKNRKATSLTELEIGVARTLLARKEYNNQKVLSVINAQRSKDAKPPINAGRISQIKNNHPSYAFVNAVPDAQANQFVLKANSQPLPTAPKEVSPIDANKISSLLTIKNEGVSLTVTITETDQIECKRSFSIKNCLRAIPAFANNQGGYIIFGINDSTWEVIGINQKKFEEFDWKKLGQQLKADLSSEIKFATACHAIQNKYVGIIYVFPATMKPVMFVRNNNDAKASEGDILYRYSSENKKIGCMELQSILDERVKNMSELVLQKHLSTILKNGAENSAVLNLATGEIEGKSDKFLISKELLPKIQFIKEGEFVEKSGAPALKLIGSLQDTGENAILQKEVNITNDRIMQAFLSPSTITDANALIMYQFDCDTLLPIFRFIELTNQTPQQVADAFKRQTTTRKKRQQKQIKRLLERKPPQAQISIENNQKLYSALLNKTVNLEEIEKGNARKILCLITHLKKSEIDFHYISTLITDIWNKFANDSNVKTALRYSLRYLDYILFTSEF